MVKVTTRGEGFKTKPVKPVQTTKRVLKYLVKNPWAFGFVVFVALLNEGLNLGGTYMLKVVVDEVVAMIQANPGHLAPLYEAVGTMFGLYIFGFILSIIQVQMMVRVAQNGLKMMRNELLNHVIRMPLTFFDKNTHGDIMSRFTNDIDMINEFFTNSLLEVMTSIFSIIGITIFIFILNWIMALVSIVFIPLMILSIQYFTVKSRKEFRNTQLVLGELEGYSEEIISGQRIVKVFNQEEECKKTFEEINERLGRHSFKSNFNSTLTMPVVNNLSTVNYILCLLVGVLLFFYQVDLPGAAVTSGVLVSYIAFQKQYTRPLNRVTQQIVSIQMALAGADRVFAILDQKLEIDDQDAKYYLETVDQESYWVNKEDSTRTKVCGDVRLFNVDFSYVKGQKILEDLSLYAKPHQKIAFVGSTGAGKTTITNLITRFYDIENGYITIDGIDLKDIDLYSLRRMMTLVLQDTHLFTGTILDNVRFGRLDATDEECIEACKIARADDFIKKLPNGYNTMIYGTHDTFSQGQRQLLSIARCAVNNPPILILDEATSSVDTRTEKLISKGMDELTNGKTTFVIAHRLSTVENSNAIIVLERGKIIERGDHNYLLSIKGRYYNLCKGIIKLE